MYWISYGVSQVTPRSHARVQAKSPSQERLRLSKAYMMGLSAPEMSQKCRIA